MKKLVAICMSLGALLGCSPMTVLAAETAAEGSAAVPFWLCVPFAGLLLCIALFPLLKPVWCGDFLVSFVYHTVCTELQRRDGAGDGSGVHD